MEVLRRIGNEESDGNEIEEVLLLKVGADMKTDFVFPFLEGTGGDEGLLGPTLWIGGVRRERFSCEKEFDLHARGGFARAGIKDVGCEFAIHERSSFKRSLAIFEISSSAVAISLVRFWAKRLGKAARIDSFLWERAQMIKGKPNFSR